jgi:hypothetical protein
MRSQSLNQPNNSLNNKNKNNNTAENIMQTATQSKEFAKWNTIGHSSL